jgi:hypothetical protein
MPQRIQASRIQTGERVNVTDTSYCAAAIWWVWWGLLGLWCIWTSGWYRTGHSCDSGNLVTTRGRIRTDVKRLILCLMVFLMGCTTITLKCPAHGVQTAVVGGSNIAVIAESLIPAIVALAPLMAARATPSPPPDTSMGEMKVRSLDLFGTTYYSCGEQPPPTGKGY